jgi:hypothetical protein
VGTIELVLQVMGQGHGFFTSRFRR